MTTRQGWWRIGWKRRWSWFTHQHGGRRWWWITVIVGIRFRSGGRKQGDFQFGCGQIVGQNGFGFQRVSRRLLANHQVANNFGMFTTIKGSILFCNVANDDNAHLIGWSWTIEITVPLDVHRSMVMMDLLDNRLSKWNQWGSIDCGRKRIRLSQKESVWKYRLSQMEFDVDFNRKNSSFEAEKNLFNTKTSSKYHASFPQKNVHKNITFLYVSLPLPQPSSHQNARQASVRAQTCWLIRFELQTSNKTWWIFTNLIDQVSRLLIQH